jgi:hypothetical protein
VPDSDEPLSSGPIVNESATTYVWLEKSLGITGNSTDLVTRLWAEARDRMYDGRAKINIGDRPGIIQSMDWGSDYWIARGAAASDINTFFPIWDPPGDLSAWPSFDIAQLANADLAGTVARTAYSPPARSVSPGQLQSHDSADAVLRFYAMQSEIKQHGDAAMIHCEHVRAWLKCAVGSFLTGLLLSPDADEESLKTVTVNRLLEARQIQQETADSMPLRLNELEEDTVEVLYSLRIDGSQLLVPYLADHRIGQPEWWRDMWDWLSADTDLSVTRHAVRMAAQIMRCPPVVQGLLDVAQSDDSGLATLALAVVRRWLLALQAMHWLEKAAEIHWRDVRPQDLACFAFSALKPEWPRRVLAISHRSPDAKATLQTTSLWSAGSCAIDASYVPAWETNTGMVWGLFGSCPAIVRLASPGYADSDWCRRESELCQYLRDHSDFMAERWLIDLPLTDVSALDQAFMTWRGASRGPSAQWRPPASLFPEFPPQCEVWTPTPLPTWETRLLCACAALRAINCHVGDAAVATFFAEHLLRGNIPPPSIPAPTNNPDGWQAYVAIFQELVNACGLDPLELPIQIPHDYPMEARQADARHFNLRMPNLTSGAPALADCLVAVEFLRTEWPGMVDERRGRFLALSLRDINRDQWTNAAQLSLHRGLLSVRTPVPVWIIQSAGQRVETWGLPADHPIFTEYLSDQFAWMLEISLGREEQQARFPDDSGLAFSAALRAVCEAGGPEPAHR